eukprot:1871017-Pyramimonas_sp.AAC.1
MAGRNTRALTHVHFEKSNSNKDTTSVDIFCQLAPQRAGINLLASPLTLLGRLYEPYLSNLSKTKA